jgi:hypothetical protein
MKKFILLLLFMAMPAIAEEEGRSFVVYDMSVPRSEVVVINGYLSRILGMEGNRFVGVDDRHTLISLSWIGITEIPRNATLLMVAGDEVEIKYGLTSPLDLPHFGNVVLSKRADLDIGIASALELAGGSTRYAYLVVVSDFGGSEPDREGAGKKNISLMQRRAAAEEKFSRLEKILHILAGQGVEILVTRYERLKKEKSPVTVAPVSPPSTQDRGNLSRRKPSRANPREGESADALLAVLFTFGFIAIVVLAIVIVRKKLREADSYPSRGERNPPDSQGPIEAADEEPTSRLDRI